MKKIHDIISSPMLTLILLILFAVAIGSATFIEEQYDIVTAKLLVYDAIWFEIVMLLLALNFIAIAIRYRLFRKEKLAGLLFHLAFILLIIGAGITRYFGFEGIMHIREKDSSNVIFSSTPYLQIEAKGKGVNFSYDRAINFSEVIKNTFHVKINTADQGEITVKYHDYIKNAVEKIRENVKDGVKFIEMIISDGSVQEIVFLMDGEIKDFGNVVLAFNNNGRPDAIRIFEQEGEIFITSPTEIVRTMMHTDNDSMQSINNITMKDSLLLFKEQYLYQTNGIVLLFKQLYKSAGKEIVQGTTDEKGSEVLLVDVVGNGTTKEIIVPVGMGFNSTAQEVTINGIVLKIAYGNKEIPLPFALYLDDFILDRYAGSMSPSSYASEVTLIDDKKGKKEKHRIYMNHVLDYSGYRFFQSSYDLDEKGTILSVNHDFWGTWISYLGYFLLGTGFVLTMFNKKSRFRVLQNNIRMIREKRRESKIAILVFLIGTSGSVFSQSTVQKPVSSEQAEKFGHLLVQTFDGRFEPINTMAFDVMHKLSRKDQFHTEKGDMNAMQVFLDILIDPVFWKNQKIILVREKSIQDILGITGRYASFLDFVEQQSVYKLSSYSEKAFRKKPSEQNTFDKEILKIDERVNIMISLLNGSILKIFPLQGSDNNKWISLSDTMAYVPLTGQFAEMIIDFRLSQPTYSNLFRSYLKSEFDAIHNGDYTIPDKLLVIIGSMQRLGTSEKLLPTSSMINLEIKYNKSQIFIVLRNCYGLLSIVLLLLAFVDNLRVKKNRIIQYVLYFFIALLGIAFLYHTYGMAMRWYLSGHAPWSNGYEALILIAWSSLLAGFTFIRYSKITVAATALLAFSILMTASHSSYDPQLTNLQPVLKSYWLVIHVAVITISYGFLALGFILGLINMCLFLFKSKVNAQRSDLLIEELTNTNEISLTVGLFLATLGTFLGGVWANESWGRYWGWDAKETWALVIIITYAIILHLRMVPKLKSSILFNAASVFCFGTVIMTFIGVNYYLSKGMHSYAADDKSVFPLWGWLVILALIFLVTLAGIKESWTKK